MSMRPERDVGWKKFYNERLVRMLKGSVFIFFCSIFIVLILNLNAPVSSAEGDCDCNVCHSSSAHDVDWQGCSTCHDSPPQTTAHLTHYNSAPVKELVYGDTAISSVDDAYKFGCGNCHPLDNLYHQNGSVEVELYNTAAPADSLKAKNLSTAAYDTTAKTCSNVYCHSGYVVFSSGPVGNPLTTADNSAYFPPNYKINRGYIMDETCSSLQYAPYTVNSGREYQTTPAWGTSGNFSVCTECHQFPLWSDYTTVEAGVGDSHYWINEYGYAYGHENNMEYFPGIGCATCHNGTANHLPGSVANPPTTYPTTWQNIDGVWLQVYSPVQLKSRVMHVNGNPDVSFDTVNGYRYYYPGYLNLLLPLTTATYDPVTKTCSDVACHYGPPLNYNQQKVKWGSPYRGWEGPTSECDQCHRYGNLNDTCTTP